MEIIMEVNHYVLTEYGNYRLKYELQEYTSEAEEVCRTYYGIRICQRRERSGELFDICQVRGITEEKEEAEELFRRIVDGLVMPVSLPDVIEDWQSAQAMVY